MCWLDACVCFLSETVRKQASLASLLLQLLSTLLGVAAGGAGCYLRFARPEIEGLLSGFVFLHYPTLLIAHGVIINLFNLFTFKNVSEGIGWLKLWSPLQFLVAVMDWRQLHRNKNLCRLYPNLLLILRFLYLLFLALVALCTIHHGTALSESFAEGFREAISLYYINPLKRWAVNKVQFELECCGVHGFRDWFSLYWLPSDHVEADKRVNVFKGMVKSFQVPYSCCNPAVPRDCIYKDVVNQSMHTRYIFDIDVTLHRRGCLQRLVETVGVVWWSLLTVALYATLVFECVLLVLLRYVQTSVRTALSFEDATLTAQGFMCYCGHTLIPSGFKMNEKGRKERIALMDALAAEGLEGKAVDYKQYDLSEEDRYWLEKEEQLNKFLNTSFHANNHNNHQSSKKHPENNNINNHQSNNNNNNLQTNNNDNLQNNNNNLQNNNHHNNQYSNNNNHYSNKNNLHSNNTKNHNKVITASLATR